jgi:peptidyl-prolyl cis-trans isomerase D
MQKHKKYFMGTIWISTIAFVGAGFVGWGSYSFSNNENINVGNEKISKYSYSELYNRYFNDLKKINKDLTQSVFNEKYETQVKNILINRLLYVNLLKDSGLKVLPTQVINNLKEYTDFKENDKFSKEKYKKILKQSNINITDFETTIKEKLLAEELLKKITNNKVNQGEIFYKYFNVEKSFKYGIFKKKNINVEISDDEIKNYWDNNYIIDKKYVNSYIELIKNKGSKKDLLKERLNLNNGKQLNKDLFVETIKLESVFFSKEKYEKSNDKIVKTIKVKTKKDFSYELEKPKIKKILMNEKINKLYSEVDKSTIKMNEKFKVSHYPFKIKGVNDLTYFQKAQLVNNIIYSNKKEDTIDLKNMYIKYEFIKNETSKEKLSKKSKEEIDKLIKEIEKNSLLDSLNKTLRNHYGVNND